MYNIEFIYLKNDGMTQTTLRYVAYANSYQEAIEQVQAYKPLEKMGATIMSIK
jgi:hypothetical protein